MPFMASNTALRRENRLKQMGAAFLHWKAEDEQGEEKVCKIDMWWEKGGGAVVRFAVMDQNCLEVLDRKLNGVVHDICYWLIVFLL